MAEVSDNSGRTKTGPLLWQLTAKTLWIFQNEQEKGIENYQFSNWSNIHSCFPSKYFEPTNIEGLREVGAWKWHFSAISWSFAYYLVYYLSDKVIYLAKETGKKIRVVGCGKSPNDIVCTTDYLVSLKHFNKVLAIDEQKQTVKVEAGITFTELNPVLEKKNLSLSVWALFRLFANTID